MTKTGQAADGENARAVPIINRGSAYDGDLEVQISCPAPFYFRRRDFDGKPGRRIFAP